MTRVFVVFVIIAIFSSATFSAKSQGRFTMVCLYFYIVHKHAKSS